MKPINKMKTEFLSKSANESFARVTAAAFAAQADPSIDILADIRTAVSEAVTNSIVHGYPDGEGIVKMECALYPGYIEIIIMDNGIGIDNLEIARTPLYTSKSDMERTGMGFTVMETFMDSLEVESTVGKGTMVKMTKQLV